MKIEDWERRVSALNRFMEGRGLKPSPWAKKAGVANGVIRNFRKGISKSLSQETLEKLAAAGGGTVAELVGEEATRQSAPQATPMAEIQSCYLDFKGDQYDAIGVYDIRASAGHGCVNDEEGAPIYHSLFRSQWLRRMSNAENSMLAVIRVSGDSMWDTLHDGDHVLVDRTQTSLRREGMFVILVEDELLIKRVSMHPGTRMVNIKSDNPAYPSFADVNPDALKVVGRVIWLGRNLG